MIPKILFIYFVIIGFAFAKFDLSPDTVVSKLAFGSCNRPEKPNPLWDDVVKFDPQVWMWLGDIVYGDSIWRSATLQDLQEKYDLQKNITGYQKLLKQCPAVIGVWDDHDFGKNNGGKEYPIRLQSQQLLLKFLDEPTTSQRWRQEGAYTSYTLGPVGKRIKIIMLDARYHRDDESSGDILGEEQWKWFEQELINTEAQLYIITSGIQILPPEKPIQEKWNNFPHSYKRLLSLIKNTETEGVLFLSGDVHYGEVFKRNCKGKYGVGYPLYEITSSGMTHSCKHQIPFGLCEIALNKIMTSKYHQGDFYTDYNYGAIQIDWEATPIKIEVQVRGPDNKVGLSTVINLDELSYGNVEGEDCSWEENVSEWKRWRYKVFQTSAAVIAAVLVTIGLVIVTAIVKALVAPKTKERRHKKESKSKVESETKDLSSEKKKKKHVSKSDKKKEVVADVDYVIKDSEDKKQEKKKSHSDKKKRN